MKSDDRYYALLAMDKLDVICYISDPETYELCYLNQTAKTLIGVTDDSYKGRMCYEILQGKDAPCEFCTNDKLKLNEPYRWPFFNKNFNVHVDIVDTFIPSEDGKPLRLEFARDVTATQNQLDNLSDRLEYEQAIASCLRTFQFETDIDKAIEFFLEKVCTYYRAQRAYIFDVDYENDLLKNSHEWCAEGITPQIGNLQAIPKEYADEWFRRFKQEGEFFITCLVDDVDKESDYYKILEAQGIDSLLAAPIIKNNKIIAFLGVDNPTSHTDDLKLLHTTSFFVNAEKDKRFYIEQLEALSFTDTLTGLYNRNRYISELRRLQEESVQNVGVCFVDINGLKQVNDVYGHEFGDILIKDSAQALKDVFDKRSIFRVGGDEFVVVYPNIEKGVFEQLINKFKTIVKEREEVNISIGHNWNDGKTDLNKQIIQADALMYNDKQNYYRSIASSKQNFSSIAKEQLFRDISGGKIEVLLQPIVGFKHGEIVAAQCVVQKRDSDSSISLNHVVPLYEEEGVIVDLDDYTLKELLKYHQSLVKAGFPLQISVQLSSVTLSQEGCAEKIGMLLDANNLPRHLLDIEIKSDFCNLKQANFKAILSSFARQNISVSMDDFGINSANISKLLLHDFHTVKIASELIRGITEEPKALNVVDAILYACKKMPSVQTLAKSVDTKECFNILNTLGCDCAKGKYFSDALSLDEFTSLLRSGDAPWK